MSELRRLVNENSDTIIPQVKVSKRARTVDGGFDDLRDEDEDDVVDDGAMDEIQLYMPLSFPEIGKPTIVAIIA